jgi:hypothetical protein
MSLFKIFTAETAANAAVMFGSFSKRRTFLESLEFCFA